MSVRKRGPQQRAEETRKAILQKGVEIFSQQGFEGVSVRALEVAADVQRGAVAYHFESKETLWKKVVDQILDGFDARLTPLETILRDLDEEARLRTVITAFVRFSAETPELNRLIIQEGCHKTWRLKYLVDKIVRDRLGWLEEMTGLLSDPHAYYMAVGAATLVFDVAYECEELFGVDPREDDFIREHASRLADMVIYMRQRAKERQAATS